MAAPSSSLQVQCTNDSSTLSKASCSSRGYFEDEWLQYFVSRCPRRAPLIHWGYWIRHEAITWLVHEFLKAHAHCEKQILSLGAGFDTLYFRLQSNNQLHQCTYIEDMVNSWIDSQVDYPQVIARKQSVIDSKPCLRHDSGYKLIGCDLTCLGDLEQLLMGIPSRHHPTLILAEVVLTYISPTRAILFASVDELIAWTNKTFPNAVFCIYEQINPFDGFGQVMLQHFQSLSSPLLNIQHYPTPHAQSQRYKALGWSTVVSCDMNALYSSLPSARRARIQSLEPFDEYEEWHEKCGHYHLQCALQGSCEGMSEQLRPLMTEPTCDDDVSSLLLRYGHCSVDIDGHILVHGGFGVSPSRAHTRLKSLVSVCRNGGKWTAEEVVTNGHQPGGLMHHSMTVLASGEVLVIGGRASPSSPSALIYLLQGHTWTTIDCTGDAWVARWRHTSTLTSGSDVVIVGGCGEGGRVLDDIMLLNVTTRRMTKLAVRLVEATHSHVAVPYGAGVLIIGGLNQHLQPLGTCYTLDCTTTIASSITTTSSDGSSIEVPMAGQVHWVLRPFHLSLPPRYSMTAHYLVDQESLILVGGVSSHETEILLLDLHQLTCREIAFKLSEKCYASMPLLFGHTSHLIDNELIIIGGGGNCFSFGTRFNLSPLISPGVNHLL